MECMILVNLSIRKFYMYVSPVTMAEGKNLGLGNMKSNHYYSVKNTISQKGCFPHK